MKHRRAGRIVHLLKCPVAAKFKTTKSLLKTSAKVQTSKFAQRSAPGELEPFVSTVCLKCTAEAAAQTATIGERSPGKYINKEINNRTNATALINTQTLAEPSCFPLSPVMALSITE